MKFPTMLGPAANVGITSCTGAMENTPALDPARTVA